MKYEGKIYGKVGGKYIELEETEKPELPVDNIVSGDSPLHYMSTLIKASGDDILITQWLIFMGWLLDYLNEQSEKINLLKTVLEAQNER